MSHDPISWDPRQLRSCRYATNHRELPDSDYSLYRRIDSQEPDEHEFPYCRNGRTKLPRHRRYGWCLSARVST